MMVVVYFAAFVFDDCGRAFIATVVAAKEIGVHARTAVNDDRAQQQSYESEQLFLHNWDKDRAEMRKCTAKSC